jgi:mRNA-degrading endonuclease RelE of RelBE toxin-antitoxin system
MRHVAETGNGIEVIKEKAYGSKVRVGNYRVLVDLTFNPDTIWVRFIDHRGRVYKR